MTDDTINDYNYMSDIYINRSLRRIEMVMYK